MKSIKEFIENNKKDLPVYFSYATFKKPAPIGKDLPETKSRFYRTLQFMPTKFYKKISQSAPITPTNEK